MGLRTNRATTAPHSLIQIAPGVPAGDFSEWLRTTEAAIKLGKHGADVPCGACTGCCRSSMFIHIRPAETRTIRRIPRAILFDAPGLPKGHLLMGYNDRGQCPMLVDDKCSIYEDRPQTCRDYDCRIFTATGICEAHESQAPIAQRVREWVFHYRSDEDRQEHATLQSAAAFLEKNRDLFPPGTLPGQPGPLAIAAIGIYRLFAGIAHQANSAIVQAIDTALSGGTPRGSRRCSPRARE